MHGKEGLILTSLTVDQVQSMLLAVAEAIVKNEQFLCEADRKIGDGDHGLGMAKGFNAVSKMLSQETFETVNPIFSKVGQTLIKTMGGASGIIFGLLFYAGTKNLQDVTELTVEHLATLLERSMQEISIKGGAQVGDKTMLDALAPFIGSLRESAVSQISMSQALHAAAFAAASGREQTKNYIARFGKAKTLGERALGYADPGAISLTIIVETMAEWVVHCDTEANA
jgi:dihydroxyacetone kinase phosphoprotein-dependent L subunit